MPALRAALYHRVSTVDQHPELAREELRAAAAARGFDVALELEETGSGASNDRPALLELLAAAQRGQLGAVVVWKLDRFGRSALDLLANLRVLERAGVRFIASSQGIDLAPGGDAMSRLQVNMLSAFAEFERELIRERTRLGMERARRRGQHVGRPRVGNFPSAAAVAHWRELGASWREVARELGCSVAAARRSLAKGGSEISGGAPVGNGVSA